MSIAPLRLMNFLFLCLFLMLLVFLGVFRVDRSKSTPNDPMKTTATNMEIIYSKYLTKNNLYKH